MRLFSKIRRKAYSGQLAPTKRLPQGTPLSNTPSIPELPLQHEKREATVLKWREIKQVDGIAIDRTNATHCDKPVPHLSNATPRGNTCPGEVLSETTSLRRIRDRVEDSILQAMERGEFDDLPGKGMPFRPEILASPHERWLISPTIQQSGYLPTWLQLQHEIEDDWAACETLVRRVERFPPYTNQHIPRDELQIRFETLRQKVRRYNLLVPAISLQRQVPTGEELFSRLERALIQGSSNRTSQ